uniref:TraM conjugative transfer protein n=2 Tax=Burkholderia cepacia TaxID=292 RepID=K4IYF1_BURCE|nr:TraM conjugative transfer protein [Burkholderia cepacia]
MMADQVEELIKEIAAKHGIAVSRDDPILILQTINNRLMQDSSKAQQAQLDQYKEELEALALRWGTDAKDKAERILNAALTASKGAMDKAMQENAKSTAATVRAEVDAALGRVAGQVKDARRIGLLNVLASCITLAAAAVALWVALR